MYFFIVFSEVALRAAKSVKRDVVTLHEVLRVKEIKSRAQQIALNPNIIKVKKYIMFGLNIYEINNNILIIIIFFYLFILFFKY
jgi:hypothetical protein